jgi:hypothetical protein
MSGEVKVKTPHGEISIDQLARIQPGMAKLMKEASDYYYYAYYAAKGGNWKLCAHQISQLRGAFRTAKVTRPKYAADLDEFDSACLVPLLRAVQAKDWPAFDAAFQRGIEGSDRYHEKYGYGYIRFMLPKEPPSDLYLGPPDTFDRKRDVKP